MEEIKLDVQVREEVGTKESKAVRRGNYIPGVVYGAGKPPTVIKVDRKIFERITRSHKGENVIFHLNVLEGENKFRDYSAITKDLQIDPVNDNILHIDFHRISLTEKIQIEVAVVAKGEAIGVKQDGGALDQHIWKLEVVCLPTQIPQHIEVDVSSLKIDDKIYVKDLVLPAGVVTKREADEIVVTVAPPMKEIKPEEAAATAATEPEVIKEKPKVAKEGEAAPATGKKAEEAKPKEAKPKAEGK